MTRDPEIDADAILATMSEKKIVNLIVDIDSTIGDMNFTQHLLKELIKYLSGDMSKEDVKTFVMKLINEK
jgi:hypothetical protein